MLPRVAVSMIAAHHDACLTQESDPDLAARMLTGRWGEVDAAATPRITNNGVAAAAPATSPLTSAAPGPTHTSGRRASAPSTPTCTSETAARQLDMSDTHHDGTA